MYLVSIFINLLFTQIVAWRIESGSIMSNNYSWSPYKIFGMNWYGMEIETRVMEGLWIRDIHSHISQMQNEGFNTLRIPLTLEGILHDHYNDPVHPDLISSCISCPNHATSWEILDMIFDSNLNIILDMHRLHFHSTSPYWYDGTSFTETDMIDGWRIVLNRYQNQSTLMGIDIYNEPHGDATWTEWSGFCRRFVKELADLLENRLVFVNGIHWGEDFREVTTDMLLPTQFVLSPHSYGPKLNHLIFTNEQEYITRWNAYYGNLHPTFAIMVGEWGGSQWYDPDVRWMTFFTNYLVSQDFGSCFWAWNPNSQDVQGYLNADWTTVNQLKQDLLRRLH
jgi:endoglucanase